MKTLTTITALLLIGATSFTFAGDNDKKKKKKGDEPKPKVEHRMAVMQLSDEDYKMFYVAGMEGKVKIRLYNEEGIRIFSKKVKTTDGFALPYNFQDLEKGKYTFEVINPDGSVIREVIDHNQIVEHIELAGLEAHVDRIGETDKFELLVMKPNLHKVHIKIRNENGVLLHQEQVNFDQGFKRVYDLNQLGAENYTFEIINGKEVKKVTTI